MNQLNQMQKQYLKNIMELNSDYISFESLSVDSAIALSVMNDSKLSIKQLENSVNSFMQSWLLLKQMQSKIVKVK